MKQKTIKNKISYKGIGLHTGNKTTLTFNPAPENTGIIFKRIDIPGKPEIIANIENVIGVIRGTTIANKDIKIHTIEHIMATLNALEIDNLIIDLDSNEPPVADGSSKIFTDILLDTGIIKQNAEKNFINIEKEIFLNKGNSSLTIIPNDKLEIHCKIDYNHPILKPQKLNFIMNTENFIKEIAPARTFCFDYEIEYMQKEGLAKGGNLDNAIVIGHNKIYNKNLRFKDEFVRHKILDLIGDIFLLGKRINGKIIAIKCGHSINTEFTKKLMKYIRSQKNDKRI